MQGWNNSSLEALRVIFKTFKSLSVLVIYGGDELNCNKIFGYDFDRAVIDLQNHYQPSFIDIKTLANGTSSVVLECDVIIVGSGCGVSVPAAEFSKAGYSVLVLEIGAILFSPSAI